MEEEILQKFVSFDFIVNPLIVQQVMHVAMWTEIMRLHIRLRRDSAT